MSVVGNVLGAIACSAIAGAGLFASGSLVPVPAVQRAIRVLGTTLEMRSRSNCMWEEWCVVVVWEERWRGGGLTWYPTPECYVEYVCPTRIDPQCRIRMLLHQFV